ncbi:MAG: carbon-nitrogen hydrolase family protein [Rhizobiales bacterium]|nr:carbon-nitrogen hydrolase family protein [Hyphomicrobiales bacterium]MBN9009101.1 carbon-nitrogen hydrolase family protein [Hyphomicrobiales bacterium]
MRVAAVQMNSGLVRRENVDKAIRYVDEAAARHGADLVVLPEFFNTIFFAQYRDKAHFSLAEKDDGPTITEIREAARRNRINILATIYEEEAAGLYYDTAMLVDRDGEIRFKYRKVHPAAVLSLEKIYFRYGTRFDTYQLDDWRVGVGICYDMAFPETARCLAVAGAELLLAPYATSRRNLFQEVLQTRSFENGCYLAAANKVGREGDWVFGGGSAIIGPAGKILASADRDNEALIVADIDREEMRQARIDFPSRRDRRPDIYTPLSAEIDPR